MFDERNMNNKYYKRLHEKIQYLLLRRDMIEKKNIFNYSFPGMSIKSINLLSWITQAPTGLYFIYEICH